jgi:hypothetical protein
VIGCIGRAVRLAGCAMSALVAVLVLLVLLGGFGGFSGMPGVGASPSPTSLRGVPLCWLDGVPRLCP